MSQVRLSRSSLGVHAIPGDRGQVSHVHEHNRAQRRQKDRRHREVLERDGGRDHELGQQVQNSQDLKRQLVRREKKRTNFCLFILN